MDCPRCEATLETKTIGDVEIDECPNCEGIWFDKGELTQAKDETAPDLNWMDFEIWKHEDLFTVAPKPINCPKCTAQMVTINYDETGVEIDYCTECQGIWLDGGEFDKIVEALEAELETKDVADSVKTSVKEGKEIADGPEKTSSEWKDFPKVMRLMEYRLFSKRPGLLNGLIEGSKGMPIW